MNKSTSFQSAGGIVFLGKLPRCFPPFLTVWGGQTEREAAFLNIKLHAARFRVCVGLLADRRITAAVCKQTLLQGGVVGADMDKGVFFSPALDLEKTAFLTIKTARTGNGSSGRLLSQDFRFFRLLTVKHRLTHALRFPRLSPCSCSSNLPISSGRRL